MTIIWMLSMPDMQTVFYSDSNAKCIFSSLARSAEHVEEINATLPIGLRCVNEDYAPKAWRLERVS